MEFSQLAATVIALGLSLFPMTANALLPNAMTLPRIADPRLDDALERTARGLVKHNIDPYGDGLVHRPYSEDPGDAVSEAQAYGMIVCLYMNDQTNFDRIWDAAESKLWNSGAKLYDWRWASKGGLSGTGMATDADQDVALMLLFADSLANKGIWKKHTSPKGAAYKARAMDIIQNIWATAVGDGKYLAPGAGWGGKEFVNPSYFSPASYRIFAKADPGHKWNDVVDQCYRTIAASPGASKGLVPDWMVPDGNYFNGSLGYNAYRQGRSMYKDGIRVHWRLALDWLWFKEPRAKQWLDAAAAFAPTPDRANFYTMDGVPIPAEDTFTLGSQEYRSRQENSELTVGMWACAAFCSQGPAASRAWSDSLVSFLPAGSDLWGRPQDMQAAGRTLSTPNEGYFEQYLAWFGAAVLAGRFTNVWDELQHPLVTTRLRSSAGPSAYGNPQNTSLRGYGCDGRSLDAGEAGAGDRPTSRSPSRTVFRPAAPIFLRPDLPGAP